MHNHSGKLNQNLIFVDDIVMLVTNEDIGDNFRVLIPNVSFYQNWHFSVTNQKMIFVANIPRLTPQEQSSDGNLPRTIVPWRDIFYNDVMIPKEKFSKFSKIMTALRMLLKFYILHSRFSLIGLCSKYFKIRSNTECSLKGQLSLGN